MVHPAMPPGWVYSKGGSPSMSVVKCEKESARVRPDSRPVKPESMPSHPAPLTAIPPVEGSTLPPNARAVAARRAQRALSPCHERARGTYSRLILVKTLIVRRVGP